MRKLAYLASFAAFGVIAFVASTGSAHAEQANTQTTEEQPKIVEVVKGDSLSKIATANETTYTRIFDANEEIKDPNVIYPGQKLRIPKAEEQLASRTPEVVAPVTKKSATSSSGSKKTTTQVKSTPVVTYTGDDSVWDALARCESGGNWAINTGNGYYGGLQFNKGTWLSNGGGAYAATANLATREQQIEIGKRVQAGRGFKPWPACARKLGLL